MSAPTQNFIPIDEVRDGVVVLKDGGLRSIIMISSVNFELKSDEEQNALINQFQRLLNSLEFPIQFFIKSRNLNIAPYLATLEKRSKEIPEELLQIQIKEYIEFIRWFTDQTNIMRKSFFVVIPYDAAITKKEGGVFGFISKLGGTSQTDTFRFEEARTQLEQRAEIVQQGLASVGLRGVQLGTQELIEVYYQIYNPGEQQGGGARFEEKVK